MRLVISLLLCGWTVALPTPSSTNFLTNMMGSFRGADAMNVTQFLSTFKMPTCLETCMPQMDSVLRIVNANSDKPAVVTGLCRQLQNTTDCSRKHGCSTTFIDTAVQAFQFVCIDNIESFGDSLVCIKDAADDLQPECEGHCGVQSGMIEKAKNNHLDQVFDVKNMCNSTMCLVHCFKDRLKTKCEGAATLTETLFSAVMRGDGRGFEEAMAWMMPDACRSQDLKFTMPKKISLESPLNVGRKSPVNGKIAKSARAMEVGVRPLPSAGPASKGKNGPMETALLIDGEIRTLQCSMLDWQRNAVPTPDFETLAKIMTAQLLPFSYPTERPVVILPDETDTRAAEERVKQAEKRATKEIEEEVKKSESVVSAPFDLPEWRGDRSDLVVPENGSSSVLYMSMFILFCAFLL